MLALAKKNVFFPRKYFFIVIFVIKRVENHVALFGKSQCG